MTDTSREAYEQEIEPRLGELQRRVYLALARIAPATDLDLQNELADLRQSTVRGRRAELVRLGLVERLGRGPDGKRWLWSTVPKARLRAKFVSRGLAEGIRGVEVAARKTEQKSLF